MDEINFGHPTSNLNVGVEENVQDYRSNAGEKGPDAYKDEKLTGRFALSWRRNGLIFVVDVGANIVRETNVFG